MTNKPMTQELLFFVKMFIAMVEGKVSVQSGGQLVRDAKALLARADTLEDGPTDSKIHGVPLI